MSTATIYLEVDGQPVAASQCHWLQIAPCGCICGVAGAGFRDEVHTTGEDAFHYDDPKVKREQSRKQGITYKLVTLEQYRAKWAEKMQANCPHTPRWGIDPIPVPDGWTWMTTDPYGGRMTYRKHLVPIGSQIYLYPLKPKALCGKEDALWSNEDHNLSDTVPCAKCEKRARDTSPVLVPVGAE